MKRPAAQESRLKRIKKCCYNAEEGTFLGRTPKNWGLIFIFYVCSYCFLAAFFMGMMSVFMYGCIKKGYPSLTGEQSILRGAPGIDFAPRVNIYNTFLQLSTSPSSINTDYIEKSNQLLDKYKSTVSNTQCTGSVRPVDPDVPCRFDVSTLGPCANPETALIQDKRPCVYLKMNHIFGWLPEMSNTTVYTHAMVECRGLNAVDDESLGSPLYYPNETLSNGKTYGYIPNDYFPFLNQPGYQTPLVGVQFPNIKKSLVVLIECHLVGLKAGSASTSFEFVVDGQ